MKRVSNTRDSYKVNDNVSMTVVNKRNEDLESGSVHYERTVTVKIKAGKFVPDLGDEEGYFDVLDLDEEEVHVECDTQRML